MSKQILGIIGALSFEVELLVAQLEDGNSTVISGITFHTGTLRGCPVVVAVSGVGKVNAAVCAQLLITVFKAERIINTGVAGGLAPYLRQGDVVISSDLVQHDMDTYCTGDPYGFISGLNTVKLTADSALCARLKALAENGDDSHKVYSGIIATGDQFIADHKQSAVIIERFDAIACEMEGGAIAQVCCMAKVPFCVVRCISDNADDSAAMSYADFASAAAKRGADLILSFCEGETV